MSANRVRSEMLAVAHRRGRRTILVASALLVVLLVLFVLELRVGPIPMSTLDAIRAIYTDGSAASFVVQELRLPRAITAMLVGFALGMSGGVFQSLTRNALGSPDVIGFTMGASTGAVVVILVFGAGGAALLAGAIGGGLVTAALVYGLSFKSGVQGFRLVLVGIGVSSLLASVVSYLLLRADLAQARNAYMWLVGSLEGAGWRDIWVVGATVAVAAPVLLRMVSRLGLLEMGDDLASALGVRVEHTRRLLLVLGTALCAAAVAVSGPIAFVALAAPQIARRLVPGPTQLLVPGLVGAALLLVSDVTSRLVTSTQNIPVGVITATAGGAYLVVLLVREQRKGNW